MLTTFGTSPVILLSCILLSAITVSSRKPYETEITGKTGRTGIIKSDEYPATYNGNCIYIYKLKNQNKKDGSIIIYAMEFLLHPLSIVKVYDGHSTSDAHRVYFDLDRPVFQSSGKKLMVVFKSGDVKPDQDAGFGFRIKYEFVGYNRGPLSSLPAVGKCGPRTMMQDERGLVEVNGSQLSKREATSTNRRAEFISCFWLLRSSNSQEDVTVRLNRTVLMSGYSDDVLSIGMGQVSTEEKNTFIRLSKLSALQSPWEFTAKSIYVFLHMHMGPNDFISFEYYTDQTANLSSTLVTPPNHCPYKKCPGSKSPCKMYWENCNSDLEMSCEVPKGKATKKCRNEKNCYTAWDMCDSFQDCGSRFTSEENNCNCASKDLTLEEGIDMMVNVSAPESFLLDTFTSNHGSWCQAACRESSKCAIFTVYLDSGHCYGRYNISRASRLDRNAISGFRDCWQAYYCFIFCEETWRTIGYAVAGIAWIVLIWGWCYYQHRKKQKAQQKAAAPAPQPQQNSTQTAAQNQNKGATGKQPQQNKAAAGTSQENNKAAGKQAQQKSAAKGASKQPQQNGKATGTQQNKATSAEQKKPPSSKAPQSKEATCKEEPNPNLLQPTTQGASSPADGRVNPAMISFSNSSANHTNPRAATEKTNHGYIPGMSITPPDPCSTTYGEIGSPFAPLPAELDIYQPVAGSLPPPPSYYAVAHPPAYQEHEENQAGGESGGGSNMGNSTDMTSTNSGFQWHAEPRRY